jgi:NAD(P)H-hydrate epimerase
MTQIYPILKLENAKAYEASVLGGDSARIAAAMQNAGTAIGRSLMADFLEIRPWPEAPSILVLAGKGLNTGDALIACGLLNASMPALRVDLFLTAPEDTINPIAGEALKTLCETMGDRLTTMSPGSELPSGPYDVCIDGLYGHGFKPPLQSEVADLLKAVNQSDGIALRVSIDLPSGVGNEADPASYVADITYIPGVAKAPCFDKSNAGFVGRVRFLEIDPFLNQPAPEGQETFVGSSSCYKKLNKFRSAQTDKRSFGHCLILAGSSQMPGAALMATMGCLQAGIGLVTTFAPATVATQIASRVPEAMWQPLPLTPEGGLDVETVRMVSKVSGRAQAMLIGPGLVLDRSTVFTICRVIRETPIPVVLDASALTQDIIAALLGRPLTAGPAIVTPHPGEFARMHGLKEIKDPVSELVRFSCKYRTVTILKGSPTYISDGNRLVAMPVGGPVLARGGSGDILSGMLTTLLAQNPDDPMGVAMAATSWHGAAGDALARDQGGIAVQTTHLLPFLSSTLRT